MLSEEQLIEARHKLSAGRITAIRMLPYFQTTLMAMVTVEKPGFGKFTVDKRWRLYYDPELCLKWTTQEIAAEWIHNVEHIVRRHDERFSALEGHSHDRQKYNAAADGAINSDLKEQGIILPNPEQQFYAESNPQFPAWKKNMSAEELYFSAGGGTEGGEPEETDSTGNNEDEESQEQNGEKDSSKDSETNDTTENNDSPKDDKTPANESENDKGNGNSEEDSEDSEETSAGESGAGEKPSEMADDAKEAEEPGDEGDDSGLPDSREGDSIHDSENEDADGSPTDVDSEGNDGSQENGEESEGESGTGTPDSEKFGKGDTENNEEGQQPSDVPGDEGSEGNGEGGQEPSDSPNGGGEPSSESNGKPLPDCGSAVGGPPREYEEHDEDDGSVDDLSADTLLKKTAEEIQEYAKSNPGKVPGGLLREAKNILEPQIDWTDEFLSLFRAITAKHAGYTNYSYSRPSRRSSGSAFILPVMRNPPAPEVAVVLDTSGSMDEGREIAMALAEMEDILNRVARFSESQSIKIINCDAKSTEVAIVRDLNDFEIIGGGGTDMRVGIQAAAELKPRADVIMTITDGFTPWPKEIPTDNPYATYVVLLVGKRASKAKPPAWMTVIEVKVPQKRLGLHK
ncbi:MAG: hypothetical protein H9W81_17365 [Enterococcus sp.]|nr:hypothetical protein [Enterococcus sp.]